MQSSWRTLPSTIRATILVALGLALLAMLVQHSSALLSKFIGYDVELKRTAAGEWRISSAPLPGGHYYLSLGRPRGLCDVKQNGQLIASTKSKVPGIRETLLLGGAVEIVAGSETAFDVICEQEGGFRPSLMHAPVLADYRLGMVLQLWRAFNELILGPFTSLGLLMFLFSRFLVSRLSSGVVVPKSLFFFAIVSLIYSLSLSYYPRLFFDGSVSTAIHVALKATFTISFLAYCGKYSRPQPIATVLNLALAVGGVLFFVWQPALLESFYDRAYIAVPASTLVVAASLLRRAPKSESEIIVRYVVVAALITQLVDGATIWINVGIYNAPAVLAMMALMIGVVHARAEARQRRIERAVSDIAKLIGEDRPVVQTISNIAFIAYQQANFSRLSAYVDSYCLGTSGTPKDTFVRIIESGYRKDTRSDATISTSEGRGLRMKEAIESGRPILRKGERDLAPYVNVGVGPHICLNLSDDRMRSDHLVAESFEVIERIHPILSALNDRLLEHSVRTGTALEKLRSARGDGVWQIEMAAIFADVCDYSNLTVEYGEGFAEFVSGVYLPALCRFVRQWAVREFSRGDEVYLVCIPDLIESSVEALRACTKTLTLIANFSANEGADLCSNSGYPTIRLTVGANYGNASLICDPFQVRTAGEMINEASRLKDAATKGTILVHKQLADRLSSEERVLLGESTSILVKRTLVVAHRFNPPKLAS